MQINTNNRAVTTFIFPKVDNQIFKSPLLKFVKDKDWYIYFSIWDFVKGSWKPVKYYADLNTADKFKLSNKERINLGNIYLKECIVLLDRGINPQTGKSILPFELQVKDLSVEQIFADLKDESPIPRLRDAVDIYIKDLNSGTDRENKENTLHTYQIFLNQFLRYATEKKFDSQRLDRIEKNKFKSFLDSLFLSGQIKEITFNNYKGYLSSFVSFFSYDFEFDNVLMNIKKKKYIAESDRFTPFSDEDLKKILTFLGRSHQVEYPNYTRTFPPNNFLALIGRIIYHSFLRPSEIARIKVKHIRHYKKGYILLSTDMTKNKKKHNNKVDINEAIVKEFEKLNLEPYFNEKSFENLYVFTPDLIPNVKPTIKYYFTKAFNTVLKKKEVNLEDRGYSLYSFKHKGNIDFYNSNKDLLGFKVFEYLKQQNRHQTIAQTEVYLRKLEIDLNDDINFKPKINLI